MRRTASRRAIAEALLAAPDARHWGYALAKTARVRSGVLYPILGKMLDAGWLADGWEDPATITEKRPPRRYYVVTDLGKEELPKMRFPDITDRTRLGRVTNRIDYNGPDGCWQWIGAVSDLGYGTVSLTGEKTKHAHRAVFELYYGPIPQGLVLDHICRNPGCVNPEHLEPVTQRENMNRGNSPSNVAKRTGYCGRGHALTPENVCIRANGHRLCRTCRDMRNDRRTVRHREEVAAMRAAKTAAGIPASPPPQRGTDGRFVLGG